MWVASQIRTIKRGYAIVAWFIFIVIYDIKMYFIMEHLWKTCSSSPAVNLPKVTLSLKTEVKSLHGVKDVISPDKDIPVAVEEKHDCSYNVISKKVLVFSQVVSLVGLYLLLTGTNYIKRHEAILVAIKMKAIWASSDILDLIQLQTSLWEEITGQFSYALAAFVYFYCYVGLMFIPPLSLAEMSQGETGRVFPFSLHRVIRISLVYVGSTIIRAYLLIAQKFTLTSTIFLGKNAICLAIEVSCQTVTSDHFFYSCILIFDYNHLLK